MDPAGSVTRLLDDLAADSASTRRRAEEEIWRRYFPQLLDLARRSIDQRTRRREDEEDVLVSMYHSFCTRLKRGEFELEGRNDLMKLLVTMTLFKSRRAVARHRRQRRDARREVVQSQADEEKSAVWVFEQMDRGEPTPADAAAFGEEVQARLAQLDPTLRQIVLWKLDGYTNAEIAASDKLSCAERTIERKLQRIRELWTRDVEPADD